MFTNQVERLNELRGLPPDQALPRLLDVLYSILGQCNQPLTHRGPVTIDAPTGVPPYNSTPPVVLNPNTTGNEEGETPEVPAGPGNEGGPASETFNPNNSYSAVTVLNYNSTVTPIDNGVTIGGGWTMFIAGATYVQNIFATNYYTSRGKKIIPGQVKVDEDDELDYLEDQFDDLTTDAPSGDAWPVFVRKLGGGGNSTLGLFVEPDLPEPCISETLAGITLGGPISYADGVISQDTYTLGYNESGCLTATFATTVSINVADFCEECEEGGGGEHESDCCEELVPATLHATFTTDDSGCCLNGQSVPLAHNAGTEKWEGSAETGCTDPLWVAVWCNGTDWIVTYNCGADATCLASPGAQSISLSGECDPFSVSGSNPGGGSDCCNPLSGTMTVTVTA